mmetsp:Transcript_33280/g.72742  ORF Transcript_33280/g.72742 Transcript_33280/m.72742 type:complete len:212 (-) Transcript_33280:289-924(-)
MTKPRCTADFKQENKCNLIDSRRWSPPLQAPGGTAPGELQSTSLCLSRRLHCGTTHAKIRISPHQATAPRWPIPFQVQLRHSGRHEELLLLRLARPEATQRLAQSLQAPPARRGFTCFLFPHLLISLGLRRRSSVRAAVGSQKLDGLLLGVAHVQRTDRWADGGDDSDHGPGNVGDHARREKDNDRFHAGGKGQVGVGVVSSAPFSSFSRC